MLRLQGGASPLQKLRGDAADGAAVHKTQPELVGLRRLPQEHPITGQRFGIGVGFRDRLFDEMERMTVLGPSMQRGLGHPALPHFVLEAQPPVGMVLAQVY